MEDQRGREGADETPKEEKWGASSVDSGYFSEKDWDMGH